ncbi:MAG: hypothetical protein PHV23_02320 [Candidatus Gracilibacteria bacterium]|nr:hypothetical protein [Candidatus Gracilibacteria bacterium]
MTKERLSSSTNILKFPTTTLMHASLDTRNVFFNKPFETIKDVQDFIVWLVRNGVMDTSIKNIDGTNLTQEQCIGKDCFILSQESINICFETLQLLKPEAKVLFTEGTEVQVSLILNNLKKSA